MMHFTRLPGYFSLVVHSAKMKFDLPRSQPVSRSSRLGSGSRGGQTRKMTVKLIL